MKLYATVTSERASKGQGGNDYIYIKIQGALPGVATLLDLEIKPDGNGHATIVKAYGILLEQLKGNKQKGEHVHEYHYGECACGELENF